MFSNGSMTQVFTLRVSFSTGHDSSPSPSLLCPPLCPGNPTFSQGPQSKEAPLSRLASD